MDIASIDSNIIVENEKDKSISVQNKDIIVANSEPEFEVTVQRKEYSVVGDELYIPKRYEDAPQWIRDLIGTVTEESFNQKITELNSLTQTLNQLIVELDVAKNTYTQSIISSNDIDERINTAITTLNSSLANSDATIVELLNTKVTLNDASSIASDVISASINSGAINALTSSIENASVDRDSALANDISLVHSELSGDIEGNADAITSLNTSVTNINNTLTAQSVDITNLSTEVNNGINTWASADSALENSLKTEISGESARVESKFAYNSIVNINGVYKKSGFGLTTNYTSGSGTQANPYVSEFWIDASRLKFTNSNQTGQVAPFTIDATGVTPQITFNGIVNFINTNIANGYPGTVKINGGLLEANTVTANQINTIGLIAENISTNEIVGKTITGSVINGARINGAVIKASYLDLDGELEVLTNYHITVAMYNANPSLYTDAVYINADNEYRIPSLSVVKEETKSVSLHSVGASSTSLVRSYNTANAGHNSKCVNIRPTLNYNGTVLTITVNVAPFSQLEGAENRLTSYATSLYCFGTFVGRFKLISTTGSGSVVYTQMYVNDVVANSFSVNINGIVFTASLSAGLAGGTSTLTVSISCPNRQLYSDFTSGNILYAVTNSNPSRATSGNAINTSVSSTSIFTTSSGMTVNNMI